MHIIELNNDRLIIIVERSDVKLAKPFALIDLRDIRDVLDHDGIKKSFLRFASKADYVFLADGDRLRVLKARYPVCA